MILNEFNEIIYSKVLSKFNKYNCVGIEQVMGSGKSYIACKLIQDNPNINFLVISKNVYCLNTFFTNLKDCKNWITCTYSKLYRYSFDELKLFLRENRIGGVIFDEFHHSGADEWQSGVENTLFYVKKNKLKCLALTATPVRYLDSARNMFVELGFEVIKGMDYNFMFTNNLCGNVNYFSLTYLQEGDNAYSSKIRNSPLLDSDKIKLLTTLDDSIRESNTKDIPEYIGSVLRNNVKTDVQKYLAFFSSIEEANSDNKLLESIFSDFEDVNFYTLTSHTNVAERNRVIDILNNAEKGIHILKVVDLANEGIHPNGLTGTFFFRRTMSPTVFLQQFGRCVSIGNKNSVFIFDLVGNLNDIQNYRDSVVSFGKEHNVDCNVVDNMDSLALNLENISNINIVAKSLKITDLLQMIDEKCGSVSDMSEQELIYFKSLYKLNGEGCFQYFVKYPIQVLRKLAIQIFGANNNVSKLTPEEVQLLKRCPYEGLDCINMITMETKKIKALRRKAKEFGVDKDMKVTHELLLEVEKSISKYGVKEAYRGVNNLHPVVTANIIDKYFKEHKVGKLLNRKAGKWWNDEYVSEIYRI